MCVFAACACVRVFVWERVGGGGGGLWRLTNTYSWTLLLGSWLSHSWKITQKARRKCFEKVFAAGRTGDKGEEKDVDKEDEEEEKKKKRKLKKKKKQTHKLEKKREENNKQKLKNNKIAKKMNEKHIKI